MVDFFCVGSLKARKKRTIGMWKVLKRLPFLSKIVYKM